MRRFSPAASAAQSLASCVPRAGCNRCSAGLGNLGRDCFLPVAFPREAFRRLSVNRYRLSPSLRRNSRTVGAFDSGGGGAGGGRGGGYGGSGNGGHGKSGDEDDGDSQGTGAGLWIWYNDLLEKQPLISKSLTSGILNLIADLICQIFFEKRGEVDWKRLISFTAIGLFMSGPGLHYWYGLLPRLITVPGIGGVFLRIAVDQLIFTPLGMLSYFVVLLTLENRSEEITQKLEKDWFPTVLANWKVWVPFQIINFGMIPSQLQVPAAGLLGMVWSIFISFAGHS